MVNICGELFQKRFQSCGADTICDRQTDSNKNHMSHVIWET